MKSLRAQSSALHTDAVERLETVTKARRNARRILRRLRNAPVNYLSFDKSSWDSSVMANCFIFMSKRINAMKETESLLAKIDNLPYDSIDEYMLPTNGWSTEDDKFSGSRKFSRHFTLNGVKFFVQLTAIPEEKSDAAGHVPKCRRVVIGEKQETRTVPLYEIICDKE